VASSSHRNSVQHSSSGFNPPSRGSSNGWNNKQNIVSMDLQSSNPQHLASPPDQPVKIQTRSPDNGTLSGWIESVGVDASYQPPPERVLKPGMFGHSSSLVSHNANALFKVACFYLQPRIAGKSPENNLHRAVYLMQRSLKDFVNAAATKCGIDPSQVLRTVRVNRRGLHIFMDDEAIQEMPEGQDMTAEFSEVSNSSQHKLNREWDAGPTDIQVDGELSTATNIPSFGYELKLLY